MRPRTPSRPMSRRCGRNSTRSSTASRRTPRPIAAGVWLEGWAAHKDRLEELLEALFDAGTRLRTRVESGPCALFEERLYLARVVLVVVVDDHLLYSAQG